VKRICDHLSHLRLQEISTAKPHSRQEKEKGIFFIDADDYETRVSNIIKNKPSEPIFAVPEELANAKYKVEIHTIVHRNKHIRKASLPFHLVNMKSK